MKSLDDVRKVKEKYLNSLYTLPDVKTCGIGGENGKFHIVLGISSKETLDALDKIQMSVEGVEIKFYLAPGEIMAQR